jgi:serine/threonine protein kinase/tetratricopeptide (TPR) repeat protein
MSERSIFLSALEVHDPVERAAYLERACAGDLALRRQVEQLLNAHEHPGPFMDHPAAELVATVDEPITERPGMVIGSYKLLEQIGEGGFGVVFMAEQQQPVRRKVALKILKPGMDTRQVIARFEAERQALALMDHPNIAHILDGGATESGRPYFVMELVRGIPITEFCDQSRLPVRERLELFINVCQAVQHAHQKGVIHRDLKPTNVLVTMHDDRAVVKVIDFGIAKATGQQLTERTLFTNFAQLIGTPTYMSPEQAQMSGLDVDTRSDIYSLGVLLYELLTGTTPFDRQRLKTLGYDEIRRVIREEEPVRPSARISTLGQAATTLSGQRRSDPEHLSRLCRHELDWIVMKCLEKDRNRRYETANGLAMDVRRYLNEEPVQACPPSARYRLQKFVGKYRTPLQFAAGFLTLLVLAVIVSTWQAVRATLAEKQTVAERDRAEASFRMARDAVDGLFMEVSQSPKLKARAMEQFRKELLLKSKDFYERFIREQFDAPEVRHDLGLAHQRLGEIQRELGDFAAAEDSLEKAVTTLSGLVQTQPEVAQHQRDLAASHSALGLVYYNTDRGEKARAAYEAALALQEKQTATDPQAPEPRYALAKTYSALGLVEDRLDQPEQAATRCQQARDTLSKLIRDYPNRSEYESLFAATQMNLGQVYLIKGLHDKAETALKEAQRVYSRLVQGRPDDLPENYESLAKSHALLGMAYGGQNQLANAEDEQQQALVIFEKLVKQHPDVPEYAYDVGRCYSELARTAGRANRLDVALTRYDKSIELMQGALERGYLRARFLLLSSRINRGAVLARRGDYLRATEELQIAARQENLSASHVYDTACAFSLASAAADHDAHLSAAERLRLKARYADQAMDFLRQAAAKGWRNPAVIKEDHDLDPLRAREDFKRLSAQLE